ncbi:chemokine-like receptor 1 [Protopterus annectens]|uniref:chemokine-like receptor 1 n=1 Tax=Protopterus annectens TaxID=7888 RepID=UPI001CFAF693|nr:chemokine-like receptor 1 [Protopterus annectens]
MSGTSENTTLEYDTDYDNDYNTIPTTKTPNEFQNEDATRILTVVVYSFTFVLGTFGNGLVIWVAGFKMKRSVNTVWFLSLAITDFFFSLFLFFNIVYAANDYNWIFGKSMCKINSSFYILNMLSSVFILTIISIDRCISVMFPVWSQNHRKPKTAYFACAGAVMLAFLLSLPSAIFRDTLTYNEKTMCYTNYLLLSKTKLNHTEAKQIRSTRQQAVTFIIFLLGFLIPLMIMMICYTIIAFKISKNRLSQSKKPFIVIIAIVLTFFLCWVPYHCVSILEVWYYHFSVRDLKMGVPISKAIATANSFMNPILYVFMGQNVKKTLLSRFENVFSEDTAQSRTSSQRVSKFSSNTYRETIKL